MPLVSPVVSLQARGLLMKGKWRDAEWGRWGLAALGGLMIALAFPKAGLTGFAWAGPAVMLAAGFGATGGQAFRMGYLAGLVSWLTQLYWLLLIPASIKVGAWQVPLAPIVGWLVLCAFLALYPALWVWGCWKLVPKSLGFGVGSLELETRGGIRDAIDVFVSTTWRERMKWALTCAALWVACEMVQARFLTGFPWNLLGASQYPLLSLIQIASVTGVYGVSFLLVWFSVALLCAGLIMIRRPEVRWAGLREIAVPVLVVAIVASFGTRRVMNYSPPTGRLKVALVQPNIPQTVIWDEKEDIPRFRQLLALSEKALQDDPDLLVWPEAAVPSFFRWNTNLIDGVMLEQAIRDLARTNDVWLIMGADDAEPSPDAPNKVNAYNSSFVVSPTGEIGAQYRKRRLVMFGEYVPLSRFLPFLKDFTTVTGEFTPGKHPVPFRLEDLNVTTSVLICFEDVFPHLAREHAASDIDFLLNVTNDGWFGESAAQWQQAVTALFRSVENGLPLVRCANNGLSCWVDRIGRMHDVYFRDSTNVYKAGYKMVFVPVWRGHRHHLTLYNRLGDWFGWSCVVIVALLALKRIYIARTRSTPRADLS